MSEINVPNRGGVIVSGRDAEPILIARIAELEAEVQALKAELASVKALAKTGATGPLGTPPVAPGRLGAQPTHVNADGTHGMRRGVSARPTPSSRDDDLADG